MRDHPIRSFYAGRPLSDLALRREYDRGTVELLERLAARPRPALELSLPPDGARCSRPSPTGSSTSTAAIWRARGPTGRPLYTGLTAVRDAIRAGEPQTRATAHIVTERLDEGPILLRSRPFPVAPLVADLRRRGLAHAVNAYAFAHQEWMLETAWGPLLTGADRADDGTDRAASRRARNRAGGSPRVDRRRRRPAMTHIRVERDGAVGLLTIDRPERFNSLDVETARDFRKAGLLLARDPAVRAVVLRGVPRRLLQRRGPEVHPGRRRAVGPRLPPGRAAGAGPATARSSSRSWSTSTARSPRSSARPSPSSRPWTAWRRPAGSESRWPATSSTPPTASSFEWAYGKTGLTGAESSTFFLPRLLGLRRAMELVLLNPRLDAARALEYGLVNGVFPAATFDAEVARHRAAPRGRADRGARHRQEPGPAGGRRRPPGPPPRPRARASSRGSPTGPTSRRASRASSRGGPRASAGAEPDARVLDRPGARRAGRGRGRAARRGHRPPAPRPHRRGVGRRRSSCSRRRTASFASARSARRRSCRSSRSRRDGSARAATERSRGARFCAARSARSRRGSAAGDEIFLDRIEMEVANV